VIETCVQTKLQGISHNLTSFLYAKVLIRCQLYVLVVLGKFQKSPSAQLPYTWLDSLNLLEACISLGKKVL
jgi:hypothetical protein